MPQFDATTKYLVERALLDGIALVGFNQLLARAVHIEFLTDAGYH